ncbi:hypothetical protein BDFB_008792 [Asbolus verrucosus]|uniref:Uncharacterized protein n=1 Tax=Asbolus verrucosus TaxID=1661398 RepID=A0A482W8R4_ASBVE|nr:hypothetical protein BDFB_008792 [Asbolus verrucosus]
MANTQLNYLLALSTLDVSLDNLDKFVIGSWSGKHGSGLLKTPRRRYGNPTQTSFVFFDGRSSARVGGVSARRRDANAAPAGASVIVSGPNPSGVLRQFRTNDGRILMSWTPVEAVVRRGGTCKLSSRNLERANFRPTQMRA